MAENGVDIAKAYVQIIPSAKGISGSISSELGGEAEQAGRSAGSRIASAIKTAIVAAGIGQAIKTAISEGAALEQSIGGIETLYKDASDRMIKYADEAFKTAGLSANDYMEQATSFAASLIASLDGDTQAAATAANTAIIDMADNANKMGTAMESIQNAYQGFAKQNYTMLDNLKLGYGGTKEEMNRLLADAQEISGIKYDISNLADVYSAIHVIQEELDITGTTSKEAAETLSGSAASMKAAFSNLLANITLGRDIEGPLQDVINTTTTYLKDNLVPAIGNIITSLPTVIGNLVGALPGLISSVISTLPGMLAQVAASLPEMINQMVTQGIPKLGMAAMNMITTLKNGVISNLPMLIEQVMPMLLSFSEEILSNANMLIDAGISLILELVNGLMEALPTLIEYVPQIITNICNIINANMPKIIAAAIAIIISLGEGLIEALPTLIANMGSIVQAIFSFIGAKNWLSLGTTILTGLANGIKSLAQTPVNIIKNIGQNIVNAFKGGISWSSLGKAVIDGIKSGIKAGASAVVDTVKGIASSALNAVKSFLGIHSPSRVFRDEVGKMLDLGFAEGITDNASVITDAMEEVSGLTTAPFDNEIQTSVVRNITASSVGTQERAANENALLQQMTELLTTFGGDITIPIYLDNNRLDTAIVSAMDRINYRSGGR